jgi:ketosteroid isomerase-like protein
LAGPLTLEDRFAIQDLVARYAWALDTGDIDALVACFTPDARIVEEVFEDPDIWEGHAGIRRISEHYRGAPNFPGRQHHTSQLLVDGNTEAADAKSFVFVTECHGEPPYLLRFAGYYEDKVVKTGGQWLFSQRTIRLWDGAVLSKFPGKGEWIPRKRPPELVVKV